MEVGEFHRRATAWFGANVDKVRGDQWDLPTPCTEWDVRALVNHLVYEHRWMPPLLAGSTLEEVGDRFEGDLLGADPKTAWWGAARDALGAVAGTPLSSIVHLSYGDDPARDYIFELSTDLLIHGWDLARSIGADDRLDPDLVELVYRDLRPKEEQLKATGLFGPKVEAPAGADLQTRLLAVVGRTGSRRAADREPTQHLEAREELGPG